MVDVKEMDIDTQTNELLAEVRKAMGKGDPEPEPKHAEPDADNAGGPSDGDEDNEKGGIMKGLQKSFDAMADLLKAIGQKKLTDEISGLPEQNSPALHTDVETVPEYEPEHDGAGAYVDKGMGGMDAGPILKAIDANMSVMNTNAADRLDRIENILNGLTKAMGGMLLANKAITSAMFSQPHMLGDNRQAPAQLGPWANKFPGRPAETPKNGITYLKSMPFAEGKKIEKAILAARKADKLSKDQCSACLDQHMVPANVMTVITPFIGVE